MIGKFNRKIEKFNSVLKSEDLRGELVEEDRGADIASANGVYALEGRHLFFTAAERRAQIEYYL